jgi:hypothetical protein
MSTEEEDTYYRNLVAEITHNEKKERERRAYEVVDEEDGIIIISMDYDKPTGYEEITGIKRNTIGGVFKKPYKGRKPGDR